MNDPYSVRHRALCDSATMDDEVPMDDDLAMDDDDGDRGEPLGNTAVEESGSEQPESQIPGIIPPAYETGDGKLEMSVRCAECGRDLSVRDLAEGHGTHCAECGPAHYAMGGPGSGRYYGKGKK